MIMSINHMGLLLDFTQPNLNFDAQNSSGRRLNQLLMDDRNIDAQYSTGRGLNQLLMGDRNIDAQDSTGRGLNQLHHDCLTELFSCLTFRGIGG